MRGGVLRRRSRRGTGRCHQRVARPGWHGQEHRLARRGSGVSTPWHCSPTHGGSPPALRRRRPDSTNRSAERTRPELVCATGLCGNPALVRRPGAVGASQTVPCAISYCIGRRECGLTLPSSGRHQSGFAALAPPLMSNGRRTDSNCGKCSGSQRMSLLHLLLLVALIALFSWAAVAALTALPAAMALLESGGSLAVATAVLLPLLVAFLSVIAAWPIASAIHLTPLRLWTPRCPQCGSSAREYRVIERSWPSLRLACPNCSGELVLHLLPARKAPTTSIEVPSYALRWPQFLGLWRRLL